ncbi:MAG: DUF2207 domain-containing protein [Patescibacteria group bacterium]
MTNTWPIKISIFASVIFFAGLMPYQVSAQLWSIDSFDAVIEVHENASLTVEETITTNFDIDKHGIFREIPVVYRDGLNNRVRIDLKVVSVARDGQPEQYLVSVSGSNKVIQIGDPLTTITGEHVYTIEYTVKQAILYFEDHDELYWNVTGTIEDSEVLIPNSTAVVTLPEGTEPTNSDCYTGYFGSNDQNCGIATEGNVVGFAAEDFLTIAVGFPKGVVYEPTGFERFVLFLKANILAVVPIFIIIAVFFLWWYLGRDPKMHKVVIAEYEPPEGLWPAYAGFMTKGSVTKWQIASMVVQMAVKGYLKFKVEENGKTIFGKPRLKTTLIKLKGADGLDDIHTQLFEAIFKKRDEIEVSKLKGKISTQVMQKVTSGIRKKLEKDGYYTKSGFILRAILFALTGIMGYFSIFFGIAMGAVTGVAFFIATVVVAVFAFLMPKMTVKGVKLLRQVLGFKLFMHTAERYRSEWQEKDNIFADYLPYAIAFHDVDRWAKTFEGLEQKNPDWYDSRMPFTNTAVFASNLTSVTNSFSAAASPQRTGASTGSSGLSGGGFSGGGFGGGGTGSW